MVNLEKLSTDEVNNKPFLINQIFDLYGDVPGEFYSYKYNGEDRWLYRDELYCTILGLEGEYIVYTSFMLNEDYELSYMEFDEFSAALNKNGEMLLWNEEKDVAESITMKERNESACVNELDGIIIHHQVNIKTGEELLISYKALYRRDPDYYQSLFTNPFIYSFINGSKVEQYMQFRTSTDYRSYDLITIKEFGLSEFLQKGAYELQKEKSITRYFKIRGQLADGTCLLFYPLFKGYTEDQMDEILKEKGFSREVNDYILDYYNGNYLECTEYKDLAEAIKEYDKINHNDKKLEKVSGDKSANN